MKKLLAILPFVFLTGCIVDAPPSTTTVQTTQCAIRGRASGTTGTTQYTCERLACDEQAFTFSCEFANISNEAQPGVSARIGLYSELTNREVLHSNIIFAKALQPGQSDVRVLRWSKAEVKPVCGASLEKCVFLVDRIFPR